MIIKKVFDRFMSIALLLYLKFLLIPFYFIPAFRNLNLIKSKVSTIYTFAGVVFLQSNLAIKIGIRKSQTVEQEHKLRSMVIKRWPDLDKILVPLTLISDIKYPALCMPNYHSLTQEDLIIENAAYLHKTFKKYICNDVTQFKLKDFEHIEAGLSIIKMSYSQANFILIKDIVNKFLEHEVVSVGFCHGDFHSRNIMIDEHEEPKLIDLDCMTISGIQDFDALHFILEYYWSMKNVHWTETLIDIIQGKVPNDFIFLLQTFNLKPSFELYISYFLHRTGLENSYYGINFPSNIMNKILIHAEGTYSK